VNFKLWGYVFPVLFIVGQGLYIARHLKDDATAGGEGSLPGNKGGKP
jgi:intracellular septation protein